MNLFTRSYLFIILSFLIHLPHLSHAAFSMRTGNLYDRFMRKSGSIKETPHSRVGSSTITFTKADGTKVGTSFNVERALKGKTNPYTKTVKTGKTYDGNGKEIKNNSLLSPVIYQKEGKGFLGFGATYKDGSGKRITRREAHQLLKTHAMQTVQKEGTQTITTRYDGRGNRKAIITVIDDRAGVSTETKAFARHGKAKEPTTTYTPMKTPDFIPEFQ